SRHDPDDSLHFRCFPSARVTEGILQYATGRLPRVSTDDCHLVINTLHWVSAERRAGSGSADRDLGTVAVRIGVDAHLLGQAHGLLDERLHDLRLGNGLDHLALDEDLTL